MKVKRSFLTAAVLLLGLCALAAAQIPDKPLARVNDLAGLLSSAEAADLERRLEGFERETSNQLALLVVDSLDGQPIEDVAVRTFEKWQLGSARNDNGVLMVVALGDRRMRIEVGYGLEASLTDAVCDSIIRNTLRPAFREQRFADGIRQGFEQIIAATRGEYVAEEQDSSNDGIALGVVLVFVILVVLLSILGSMFGTAGRVRGRRGSFWTAGAGGLSSGDWGGGGGFSGFSGGGGSSGGGGASGSW